MPIPLIGWGAAILATGAVSYFSGSSAAYDDALEKALKPLPPSLVTSNTFASFVKLGIYGIFLLIVFGIFKQGKGIIKMLK